ncbi:hypothetical protein HDU96_001664 [Phlyctochytrium bullatum]|nr:hypothetical protein HDU96_001664 [Phlyctochytrium bullatum]
MSSATILPAETPAAVTATDVATTQEVQPANPETGNTTPTASTIEEEKCDFSLDDSAKAAARKESSAGIGIRDADDESFPPMTAEEEKQMLRKMDQRLIPLVSFFYLLCFLDRVNIGNARVIGLDKKTYLGEMERDLGMTDSSQYNWALSIFFFGYIIFEVPSNNMLKYFTPSVWIARIMITWGICATCLAFTFNFGSLMACRAMLGVFEAGFFPGVLFFLSFWYRKKELAFRYGLFFAASTMAGAFSGLIAYFLTHVHMGYISTWRAVFFWEGVPTVLVGISVFWLLPNFPHTAKFLTPKERWHAVQRLKEDGIDSRDHSFKWDEFKETVKDVRVWCSMLLYLGLVAPTYGFAFMLPTIVSLLGFTDLNAQILTVPPYIIACLFVLAVCYSSDRFMERSLHMIACASLAVVGFIALALYRGDQWILYAMATIALIGIQPCVPLSISWMTNNQAGQTRTATATAMMVAFGNIGGILGPQIFRREDAANGYRNAHLIMCGFLLFNIFWTVVLRIILARDAAKLDRQGSGATTAGDVESGKKAAGAVRTVQF